MNRYIFILLFVVSVYSQRPGYSGAINIGSNDYTVGINIDLTAYPNGTAYNIADPNNFVLTTSTIQAAIDTIGNNGGGTIHFKAGLYVCITNIHISSNGIHLTGEGIDTTIIKLADYAPSFINGTDMNSGLIRAHLNSEIIISNMTLDGNKNNQYTSDAYVYGRYGIFTEGATNVWFDNVKIVNFQGFGFNPCGWKLTNTWGKYLTITNCIAEYNDYDGFTVDQTYDIFIDNCTSGYNGRHGYNIVTGSSNATITNNVAISNGFGNPFGSTGCGFTIQNNLFFGTSTVVIMNNVIIQSRKAGICINDVHDVLISGNYVNDTTFCLSLVSVRLTDITQNTCLTPRFIITQNTSITYGPGTDDGVHIYDNNAGSGTSTLLASASAATTAQAAITTSLATHTTFSHNTASTTTSMANIIDISAIIVPLIILFI